jgi:Cu2+-containing amine oxidase
MATKRAVNKTQAVLDYLKAHPGAMCREIAAALDKQGIKITLNYIATIKARAHEAAALPVKEKPLDTLTLDRLKKLVRAMKRARSRKTAAKTTARLEKPADTLTLNVKKCARAIDRIPRKAAVRTTAPPIEEKPVDTLTSDQLKMVARAMKAARSRLPDDPDT